MTNLCLVDDLIHENQTHFVVNMESNLRDMAGETCYTHTFLKRLHVLGVYVVTSTRINIKRNDAFSGLLTDRKLEFLLLHGKNPGHLFYPTRDTR